MVPALVGRTLASERRLAPSPARPRFLRPHRARCRRRLARPRWILKQAGTEELAAATPFNEAKLTEYAVDDSEVKALEGESHRPSDPIVGSSTVQEGASSSKVGNGKPELGVNRTIAPLDRVRVDSTGRHLTTNQGVPIADNQNSLKAGLRGPTLLEDFILREKITHFDHERIPERIVHARGSGAHGFFECYQPLAEVHARGALRGGRQAHAGVRALLDRRRRARLDRHRARRARLRGQVLHRRGQLGPRRQQHPGVLHPGRDEVPRPRPRGEARAAPRDAAGASSAHDTFWDFVSLMPESTHMLMWVMSDRAIPRSYRMMQGFGVHTFRLVNAAGESRFVQVPLDAAAGHALAGLGRGRQDLRRRPRLPPPRPLGGDRGRRVSRVRARRADLHRGAGGAASASTCSTRPRSCRRSWCRCSRSAAWCSNRNPDNFFAETEQVAFCTAHVVPGHRLLQRPAAAGRIHSYFDTQISRLGGPNFHEIPINAPVAQVHNNQRDGIHRQAIHRGRVAYEPNSLGGGCPFQAGATRLHVVPASRSRTTRCAASRRSSPTTTRRRRSSGTARRRYEQAHIVARLPLRADQGAGAGDPRAHGLDAGERGARAGRGRRRRGWASRCREPHAARAREPGQARGRRSRRRCRSLARPGDGSVAGRRVAVLVADGVDGAATLAFHAALARPARRRASSRPGWAG